MFSKIKIGDIIARIDSKNGYIIEGICNYVTSYSKLISGIWEKIIIIYISTLIEENYEIHETGIIDRVEDTEDFFNNNFIILSQKDFDDYCNDLKTLKNIK